MRFYFKYLKVVERTPHRLKTSFLRKNAIVGFPKLSFFFCNFSPQLFESAGERAVIIVEFRLSALSFSAQQSFSRIFGRTNMRLGWEVVSDPLPKIFGYLPRKSQKMYLWQVEKEFFSILSAKFLYGICTSKTQNPRLKNLIRH